MAINSSLNPTTQRDRDFLRVCRRILALSPRTDLTAAEVAEIAAGSPAPSYYLSYDYARRMVSERRRGVRTVRNPMPASDSQPIERRRDEIVRKVEALMARYPGLKERDAIARVLAGPASSFFIAPDTARRLFTHLRRPLRRPHHPHS